MFTRGFSKVASLRTGMLGIKAPTARVAKTIGAFGTAPGSVVSNSGVSASRIPHSVHNFGVGKPKNLQGLTTVRKH